MNFQLNKIRSFFLYNFCYPIASLFFPRYCSGCGDLLESISIHICPTCLLKLPRAEMVSLKNNKTAQQFWGRVRVEFAVSFCYFMKQGILQNLLHHLKYNRQSIIGLELGKIFGAELVSMFNENPIDIIVPVPLHSKKEKKRGYNQAEKIADGIAMHLLVPVETKAVKRRRHHQSQTKLNRFDRWKNVQNLFEIVKEQELKDKHILLVDDVVTTGATLESLALVLQELEGTTISIATIAVA